MKHFQDLGHTVVYVVGSFTALIGDPTGRSKTRPPLTLDEIARTRRRTRRRFSRSSIRPRPSRGSTASGSSRSVASGWVKLAAKYNVAQMLERRDFKKRYESGQADRGPRVPVSAGAGLRLRIPEGGCRAGRHRPVVQSERRSRPDACVRARAAGRDDDAAARGARRRREDVQEPGQLRGRDRRAGGDVREADVDLRRADVEVLHVTDGPLDRPTCSSCESA